MTERIDHVAEAHKCGKRAEHATTETEALAQLVSAHAHATLALVEQQRIANLIALWMGDSAIVPDVKFDEVAHEIARGVGL